MMKRTVLIGIFFLVAVVAYNQEYKVETMFDGFKFTEGPAFDADGNLYFSDIPPAKIYKVDTDGELSVYKSESGGANGLYFDKQGRLVACAGKARQIVRLDAEGNVEVLADSYDGKKLNSPNDLWIDPHGGIYFTDPRYGSMDDLQQDGMHVYYLAQGAKKLKRVTNDLKKPNGLIGSLDGRYLYIVDGGAKKTFRYTVQKDGSLTSPELILEAGNDGMSVDNKGRIYVTVDDGIEVYDPADASTFLVPLNVKPTNVTWHDGAIFITTQAGTLLRIKGF